MTREQLIERLRERFEEWFRHSGVDFWSECNAPDELARAALAVLEAHAAVVLREPTPKMCDAGADELPTQTCESTDEEAAAEIYRAMLAASPYAPEMSDE